MGTWSRHKQGETPSNLEPAPGIRGRKHIGCLVLHVSNFPQTKHETIYYSILYVLTLPPEYPPH